LDGRLGDATAGFLDAWQGFADIGVEWLQTEMAIDAVLLLPNEPQIQPLAEKARQILKPVRATVLLDQLEAALSAAGKPQLSAERPELSPPAAVAVERETS
jgi:hypothetical protein